MQMADLCDNILKKDQIVTLLMAVEVSNHLRGKNVSFQEVTGINPQCQPLGQGELNTQNRPSLDSATKHFKRTEGPAWLPSALFPSRLWLTHLTRVQLGAILF